MSLTRPILLHLGVIVESDKIVEGTWRRMFELDLREDASDFASKAVEQETKALMDGMNTSHLYSVEASLIIFYFTTVSS